MLDLVDEFTKIVPNGLFIYQFELETKTLIRKLERISIKLYGQNVFVI